MKIVNQFFSKHKKVKEKINITKEFQKIYGKKPTVDELQQFKNKGR